MYFRSFVAVTFALAAVVPGHAAVYLLDRTVGSVRAQGSITTDGTVGLLSAGNIVDFQFDINGFDLTPTTGGFTLDNNVLRATSTELLFEFSLKPPDIDPFRLDFYSSCTNSTGCYELGFYSIRSIDNGFVTILAVPPGGPGGPNFITVPAVETVIANVAAVPELSTWAMMLFGFAGVTFIAHRRHNAKFFPNQLPFNQVEHS
jgi:hypothetical protein